MQSRRDVPAGSSLAIAPTWIRVLSHPTRIALLRRLVEEPEASPTTLAATLELPLANVSHHIRFLRDAQRIVLVRKVPRRGAVEHLYTLNDRDETIDILGRFGIAAAPEAIRNLRVNEPWERVQRAVRYLRRRREEQNLSREALARRLQIKASYLASIERGETDPRSSVLAGMAQELGTSVGQVFALVER